MVKQVKSYDLHHKASYPDRARHLSEHQDVGGRLSDVNVVQIYDVITGHCHPVLLCGVQITVVRDGVTTRHFEIIMVELLLLVNAIRRVTTSLVPDFIQLFNVLNIGQSLLLSQDFSVLIVKFILMLNVVRKNAIRLGSIFAAWLRFSFGAPTLAL